MADQQLIYNCPGCGKPTKAPEGALTNQCEYCALVVRIGAPHRILKYFYQSKIDRYAARMVVDRYLKSKNLPLSSGVVEAQFYYLPFYRFRGMAMDYIAPPSEIKEVIEGEVIRVQSKFKLKAKDFDITTPAFSSNKFGLSSLGMRPQSIPLYAYSQDEIPDDAIIVKSDISPAEAETKAMNLHKHNVGLYNRGKVLCSAMIGEQISVIYFPVWAVSYKSSEGVKTTFVDALAKRGYAQVKDVFKFNDKASAEKDIYFIQLMKHQCPNCGADLEEKHFSLFYPCSNCKRFYILADDGYKQTKCLAADTPICAPYWRFPLEFQARKSYKTVKEFYNLLPSEIALLRKEKGENRFYLYNPAFKSSDVNRLVSRAMTVLRTQPHDKLVEKVPAKGPVMSIDEAEAREMAVFLWNIATFKYPRLRLKEFYLDEENLPPGEIVWLPMQDTRLIVKSTTYRQVNVVD